MKQPVCIIIAGPNGSGKTTFALKYLSETAACNRFINADLIASGLSPLLPESKQIAASRLFLDEINYSVEQEEDFSFETTLSGKTYLKLIKKLQQNGWRIELIYLYLPNVEISAERVAERVRHGGHNIPADAIIRRYPRSLYNLINYYAPLCDKTICIDNSGEQTTLIFTQEQMEITISNQQAYQNIILKVSQ